jgi:mono/diheme cytochrome c family protein
MIPVIAFSSRLIGFAAALVFCSCYARNLHALGSNLKGDEEAGAILFRDKGCAHCHGAGGTGGKKGPDLSGLRTDKLWPPANITHQILNGGQKMPPFSDSLTDAEIGQLVAYLRAKHRPIPRPAATPAAPPAN